MNDAKIQANRRLIGKTIKILDSDFEWVGEVVDVKDEDTFLVSNGETLVTVDIFDIRSVD
jgi:hypothetical protein